ncbi:MAG: mechanosensitive ion channel family protein, partial [Candidatus Bathyarchaeia archaeon]
MSIGSSPQKEQSDKAEIAGNVAKAMVKVVLYIVLYVAVAAIIQWLFTSFMLQFGINIVDYIGYIQVLLAIAFGYLIVSGIASF